MQSTSVSLDITKFADSRWKIADVNKTQGVWHVIHLDHLDRVPFGSSLGRV